LTKNSKETSEFDFLWIREPFHEGKNRTGKTIVFGHTITPMLYGDMQTTSLWESDGKIGIDGGAVFGGSLHGVVFDTKGIVQDYELPNEHGPWQPDF
jgi:serine/threonine protein phosphatase 1